MQKIFIQLLILCQVYSMQHNSSFSPGPIFTKQKHRLNGNSCDRNPFLRECTKYWNAGFSTVKTSNEKLIDYTKYYSNAYHDAPFRTDSGQNVFITKKQMDVSGNSSLSNHNSMAAVIEGTGPFYCGLRASSELNSGVLSIFVRDIGFYRCYFHGGARLVKVAVLGAGFYQCYFQRPGTQLVIRQGIGMYFCFFQGIRHAHGFILKAPKPELNNFLYFLGSVNFALRSSTAPIPAGRKPLASGQVLGIYNFAPDGTNANFGLLQATESFNLRLPPVPLIGDNSTLLQVLKQSSSEASIDQMGMFQYHYTGADFEQGRANRFGSIAYNFQRVFEAHAFAAQLFLFELVGQGQRPEDDRDFLQAWITYTFTLPPSELSIAAPYIRILFVGQYNYLTYELPNARSHGLDFIQLILVFSETFRGFQPTDNIVLNLNLIVQSNFDLEPKYVPKQPQDADSQLVEDGLIMTVFQVTYNFLRQEGSVNGLAHMYLFKQWYLNEVLEEEPGYLQLVFIYIKNYRPFERLNHAAVWSVSTLLEYVIGEPELTNWVVKLQGQIVIDTTAFTEDDLALSSTLEVNVQPSTLTIQGLFQCITYGIRRFRPVCFFQIYVFYIGTIVGVQGFGQSVLLAQFYQDVRTE